MTIYGMEKFLGAMYEAKRIENGEKVYGLAAIKVDDEKSYLIQMFETDDFTDGAPARAYYVAVWTNTVTLIEDKNKDEKKVQECKDWPKCEECPENYLCEYKNLMSFIGKAAMEAD